MISYISHIGKTLDHLPTLPTRATGQLSLNTPVGSCVDHYGRVWLADTAHNRLLVLDANLQQLLACYGCTGRAPGQFNMPFRLLAHPDKPWIYVTDMANARIQLLEYNQALQISCLYTFGNTAPVKLTGPNGIVFHQQKICVADEFYEGQDGESRLVIFDEEGHFIDQITSIQYPDQQRDAIKLLWPQGLTLDPSGNICIANTGFNTVVRCNWQGQAVPFAATGKAYIEGLQLTRDVSCVQNRLLIPGGEASAISIYSLDGEHQGRLKGFFAPIQITESSQPGCLLITEPILASLQLHRIDLQQITAGATRFSQVLNTIGGDRDQPGQFHFVAAAAGGLPDTAAAPPLVQAASLRQWLEQQQQNFAQHWQTPALPSWLSLTLSWQTEWLSRWQQSWWRLVLGDGLSHPEKLLWLVDSGNYQLQTTAWQQTDSARPTSSPLLPGSLGITALKTSQRLAGQLDHRIPLLVVCNYLTSLVTIYQYHPLLDDLVPYRVFGSYGSLPWQLKNPQGLAIDPLNNDILIADSGNHRIARWRLTRSGIAGLVEVFGKAGEGNGEFNTPSDISLDENGQCYVADQFNHRIQVFDQHGKWLYSFGEPGYSNNSAHFLLPTSLAWQQGHLIVSDLVNRAIKVFDDQGQFIDSFNGFGADPDQGQLWMPYLMHLKDNKIYLPDCALNRVNIYQLDLDDQT